MVEHTLPRHNGGQMGRLKRRYLPLLDGEIGDAQQTDLAGRPGLRGGPFDRVIKISRLQRRHHFIESGRLSGSARVDHNHCVARRYPTLWVRDFPRQVSSVGLALYDLGMIAQRNLDTADFVDLVDDPELWRQVASAVSHAWGGRKYLKQVQHRLAAESARDPDDHARACRSHRAETAAAVRSSARQTARCR